MIDQILQKVEKLPPAERVVAMRRAKADFYEQDLFATCKYLIGFKEMNWRTHGELIEVLESPLRRKLICYPRGGFKSSITVIGYAIWRMIRNPEIRILLDSELFTNSKNFLRAIRGHLERPEFTELWGSFEGPVWHESELTIAQRKQPRVEATITCGGVGTTKVGQHYDLIIGDDYNSPKNSNTPEKCEQIIAHYKYNLSILDPDGEYVLIGTRYAEQDLIGWVLRDLLGLEDLADGKLPGEGPGKGLIKGARDGIEKEETRKEGD